MTLYYYSYFSELLEFPLPNDSPYASPRCDIVTPHVARAPLLPLLVIVNAPRHPVIEHPNTGHIPASQFHMDPTVIDKGIVMYDAPELIVLSMLKPYNIAECFINIKGCIDEVVKINACWQKLWIEAVTMIHNVEETTMEELEELITSQNEVAE
ncbi:hypothetical protein J6590_038953 [Homalodisca vitripennis]|nr:hypothetical protein J6590_038953 [Homalodisca vitripennis]